MRQQTVDASSWVCSSAQIPDVGSLLMDSGKSNRRAHKRTPTADEDATLLAWLEWRISQIGEAQFFAALEHFPPTKAEALGIKRWLEKYMPALERNPTVKREARKLKRWLTAFIAIEPRGRSRR